MQPTRPRLMPLRIAVVLLLLGCIFDGRLAGTSRSPHAATSSIPQAEDDIVPSSSSSSSSSNDAKSSSAPPPPLHEVKLLVGTAGQWRHPADIEWRLKAATRADQHFGKPICDGEGFETCVSALLTICRGGEGVKEAIDQLHSVGSLGNRDALYYLGEIYHYGSIHSLRHVHQYVPPVVERDVKKAIEYYDAAAGMGHPQAHTALGHQYAIGRHVPRNHAKSLIHYQTAAMDGDYEARMVMSHRYHVGDGVKMSCREATEWYEPVAQAVAQDVIDSGFDWVMEHERLAKIELADVQEEEDIVQYYHYAAESGDVTSQVTLGILYLGGVHVPRDYVQARHFFSLASEENDSSGIFYMGVMAQKALGMEEDSASALEHFERAARLGSADAQAELGLMYLQGSGVKQNFKKAVSYFNKAVERGNAKAHLYMSLCHLYNIGGVKKDYTKASKYLASSASAGVVAAKFNLAQMYNQGVGLSRSCGNALMLFKKVAESGFMGTMAKQAYHAYEAGDYHGALLWYERAGALGMEVAQHNVAWMLEHELGLEHGDGDGDGEEDAANHSMFEYYRKCAQQHNPTAHMKMGDSYFYGRGTKKSHKNAAIAYQRASNLGNAQATFNLGYMHQHGLGMTRDLFLAKRYFDMASEQNPEALVPSKLALIWLGITYVWEYPYEQLWSGDGGAVDSSAGSASTAAGGDSGSGGGDALEEEGDASSIDVFSPRGSLPSPGSSPAYDWDMIVIIVLAGVLGLLIMLRQHVVRNAIIEE